MKVLIIGGGIAGLSVARDLMLRGIGCVLMERKEIGGGTTTKCAGMLHSGARYAVSDPENAKLCLHENRIMRMIVPFTVGKQDGLFVILRNDTDEYGQKFLSSAEHNGLPVKRLSQKEAVELEPNLGSEVIGGYLTPDTTIHTHLLVYAYSEELKQHGVQIFAHSSPVNIVRQGKKWKVTIEQKSANRTVTVVVDSIVNCAGAWIKDVASLFGANIEVRLVYGSMAVFDKRLSSRIVSRCAPNAVGDVIVPIHNGSLVGSTWYERESHAQIPLSPDDEITIKETSANMIPAFKKMKAIGSFTGVRVHASNETSRTLFGRQRNYSILNHDADGTENCITILPGKLTTARYAAEKACDVLLDRFGIHTRSQTSTTPVPIPQNIPQFPHDFYLL